MTKVTGQPTFAETIAIIQKSEPVLQKSISHTRHGLTALELLVATTLAAMMIVATMGLLRTMALQQSVLRSQTAFEPWHRPLAEQLRRDVVNARSLELQQSTDRHASGKLTTTAGSPQVQEFQRLVLTGYCSSSPHTHRPTHRPARVTYSVQSVGSESWLVRREELLVSMSNRNVRKELVCSGVTAIVLEELGTEQQLRSGTPPDSCCISLVGSDASSPLLKINVCR